MTLTNEQAQALGHRWIAAGGGWREGMVAIYCMRRGRVVRGSFGELDWHGEELRSGFVGRFDKTVGGQTAWPDLRDPATRGAALEVVRERWMDGWAHIFFANGEWCLRVLPGGAMLEPFSYARLRDFRAASEAETLILALEAAPPVKP